MIRHGRSILLLFLLCASVAAQPLLHFKRIEVNYPKITCAFRVSCGGAFRTDITPMNMEVRENGFLMNDVTVYCPDSQDCCVSISMVLDRTGSMSESAPPSGRKIDQLKAGANLFVDQLNTPCDEVSLVTFSTVPSLEFSLGTNKVALKNAINAMLPEGSTPLWDATALGIQQLGGAKNRCKALILFTDGGDNNSHSYTINSVIALAQKNSIKIFTIGFGDASHGTGIREADLQKVADLTGGEYYHAADGTQLMAIYQSIRQFIKDSYQECIITYTSGCPDGSQRIVDLTVKDYCGGTVTAQKTYVAPLDRSKFQTVQISLGHGECYGTREAIIPVMLNTPVNGIFSTCDFTIVYDRRFATITGYTTAGTLLDGVPISMQDVGSGHLFSVKSHVPMNGSSGPLKTNARNRRPAC